MTRHDALVRFAARLNDACLASDWSALAEIDAQLAASLPQWVAAGHWTPAEQLALARLRLGHRAALELCARRSDELAVRLRGMNAHKDGWLAYAADSTWEDLHA